MRPSFVLLALGCLLSAATAQWEPDARLTFNDSVSTTGGGNSPGIAAVGETLHVVWSDNRNGGYQVYYKRSTDGGASWGADVRLTTDAVLAGNATVAANARYVYVAWNDSREGTGKLYYERSTDAGLTWGTESRLPTTDYSSVDAAIALSESSVHVIYYMTHGTQFQSVFYLRSIDNGSTWGTETRLASTSEGTCATPSIAAEDSWVHAAWSSIPLVAIYYRRSTDLGATWATDTAISDTFAGLPCISASRGHVHAAWRTMPGETTGIDYRHSSDRGQTWGSVSKLTGRVGGTFCPAIAACGKSVHVAWYDNPSGQYHIFYKRSTDWGATWSADTMLTTGPLDSSQNCSVAAAGTRVHVIWYDHRDGNDEIYCKRNPTGNIGIAELVPPHRLRVTPNPAIVRGVLTTARSEPGARARTELLNVSGRNVLDLRPGANDVSGLAPGVYFVRAVSSELSAVSCHKVVLTR